MSEESSETLESVPEARIGYNNYMLANQLGQFGQLGQNNYMLANQNQLSQYNQLGGQFGQSSNRVDTKLSQSSSTDYDYNTGPASSYQQGSNSNLLQSSNTNNNNGGIGYLDYFDYDSTNYSPAASLNMNYDMGMGIGNSMGYSNNNYRKLLRRRNGLMSGAQLGNGQSAGQLGQLGGQMNGQLGGQLNNRADSLGLGSSGYGATGFGGGATGYGGGATGYGGGSGYGAPVSIVSGYGGGSGQCATGVNPLLALLTLAGAAVGFYFIYVKLTMSAGQRRSSNSYYVDEVADMLFIGINLNLIIMN